MPVTLDKKAKTALVTIRPREIIDEDLAGAATLKEFLIKRANKEFEETHEVLFHRWVRCRGSTQTFNTKCYDHDYYFRIVYDWSCEEED